MRWLNVFLLIAVLLLTSIDYSSSLKGLADVAEGADTSAEPTTLRQGAQGADNEERNIIRPLLEPFRRFFGSINRWVKSTFVHVDSAFKNLRLKNEDYLRLEQGDSITHATNPVEELFLSKKFEKWHDTYGKTNPTTMIKALYDFFGDDAFIKVMDVVLASQKLSKSQKQWSEELFYFFKKHETTRINMFKKLAVEVGEKYKDSPSWKVYVKFNNDRKFRKKVDLFNNRYNRYEEEIK